MHMNDRYRFYYERLPACMRREYETFLQGILNRKERISFSGSFSIDCIRRIVDAVNSENAEAIWWLTDGVTYIAGAHGTTVLPNYSGLSVEEIGRRLQLLSAWKNAVVDAILRREPMCDVDKIWLIAQHVCSRMRYDNSDSISFEDRHSIWGAYSGAGVCEAIAKAFYFIASDSRLGLKPLCVIGRLRNGPDDASAEPNHIWNAVVIDGNLFHLDLTMQIQRAHMPFMKVERQLLLTRSQMTDYIPNTAVPPTCTRIC